MASTVQTHRWKRPTASVAKLCDYTFKGSASTRWRNRWQYLVGHFCINPMTNDPKIIVHRAHVSLPGYRRRTERHQLRKEDGAWRHAGTRADEREAPVTRKINWKQNSLNITSGKRTANYKYVARYKVQTMVLPKMQAFLRCYTVSTGK